MTKAQQSQLSQIMAVADVRQISFGEYNNGVTHDNLSLCYVLNRVWFNETISPKGWVISRTMVREDE